MLLDGLRTIFLCRPRSASIGAGAGTFLALIVAYFIVSFAIALVDTPAPWQFDARGVSTLLTDSILTLIAAWLLVDLARRREVIWGAASILLAATIAIAVVVHWPIEHIADALSARGDTLAANSLDLAGRAWWFVVLAVFARRLAPRHLGSVLLAAVLAYAVSAATWWYLPASPLLTTRAQGNAEDVDLQPSASGGDGDATPDDGEQQPTFDAETVMYDQPKLLDAALAKITPQTPGRIDLYVIAFAGDAEEDVFRNEVEYAARLFTQRFDAQGHVLVLENNPATVATHPLATWTSLHQALEAIAKKMDPAEDILLVYLTTHGSEDHQLLVDLDPLPLDQIGPVDLSDALKTTPSIRWKVIVVNACYSGGFIDALHDDSTLVITSARADRTSFGCGSDSDITYFGKAFLVDALNKTTSLRDAFDLAKQSVATWETADKEEHSEPQIATSPSIEAKLGEWQKQLRPQASVPFAPAAAATDGNE
jgi:hypothetical protein